MPHSLVYKNVHANYKGLEKCQLHVCVCQLLLHYALSEK